MRFGLPGPLPVDDDGPVEIRGGCGRESFLGPARTAAADLDGAIEYLERGDNEGATIRAQPSTCTGGWAPSSSRTRRSNSPSWPAEARCGGARD